MDEPDQALAAGRLYGTVALYRAHVMRIGVETSALSFNNAGSARYCQAILDALRAQTFSEIDLVELRVTHNLRLPQAGLARKILVAYWEFIYCTRILPVYLKRHNIDLLHCTTPMPLHPRLHETGAKIVTTIFDVIPFSHPQWFSPVMGRRLRRWIRRSVKYSDHLIAISHFTKRSLSRYFAPPDDRITVTHLGVTRPQAVARLELGQPLLTVGTLEPRKNLSIVVEAYYGLKKHLNSLPKLLIVGGKGWGDVALRGLIHQYGLKDSVELLGFVPDAQLFALYQAARALIYPSLQEGFGLPVLEAMACGCPVIIANSSSLPEVAGEAGILVDPHDVSQVTDTMRRVLTDDTLVRDMRQKGIQRARLFSWESCAQQTVAVYRALLDR